MATAPTDSSAGLRAASHRAVDALARELNLPFEYVERVYLDEASALQASARVKNFVPALVTGRTRAELRRRQRRAAT
jgi:hypothetical protein